MMLNDGHLVTSMLFQDSSLAHFCIRKAVCPEKPGKILVHPGARPSSLL